MKKQIVVKALDVRFGDIVFVATNNSNTSFKPHLVANPNAPTKHYTKRRCISFTDGTGIAVLPEEQLHILREVQ